MSLTIVETGNLEAHPERRASAVEVALAGLVAAPAAALGAVASERGWRPPVRVAAWVVTALMAAALLAAPLRWQVTSLIWLLLCLGAVATALIGRRPADAAAAARSPLSGRNVLRALGLSAFVMPALLLVAQTVAAAIVGPLLVHLDPSAVDPETLWARMMLGILWTVPAGGVFAVVALRRGMMRCADDAVRAALSWLVVLILLQAVVGGSTGALERLMLPAELAGGWGSSRGALLQIVFGVFAVPLTLGLVDDRRRPWRRLATAAGLVFAGTCNLAILLGMTPMLHFAAARAWERAGRPEAALEAYARSLRSRATPLIESYVQHRIGVLQYRLGNEDKAAAAFRLVQASHNGNSDLVHEAGYLLDRLADRPGGRRVVLPGVTGATEHRAAYCAPNTLARVLGFWGSRARPGAIGEEVALIGYGTSGTGVVRACWLNGFEQILVPFATADDLEWLIDNGVPALVYRPGHVLSVFGYDTRLGTFVTYDTAQWDIWVDQPVPDLLQPWGEDFFVLGVVLPLDDHGPTASAVRQRFRTPSAAATWYWWLAAETEDYDDRRAYRRAALAADPTFFPVAFELLETEPDRGWLDANSDAEAIADRAWRFLDRPYAATADVAAGLSKWLLSLGRTDDVLRLAEQMERRGLLDAVREPAGRAAVQRGDWQRAAFLLAGEQRTPEALAARARSEIELGHLDAAAATIEALAASARGGVDREAAVVLVNALGPGAAPKLLESVYRTALAPDPFEPGRQLLLARTALAVIDEHDERATRRDRLQSIRLAASIARIVATTSEQRAEAEAILVRVAVLSRT